jgi:hypothetical protein
LSSVAWKGDPVREQLIAAAKERKSVAFYDAISQEDQIRAAAFDIRQWFNIQVEIIRQGHNIVVTFK